MKREIKFRAWDSHILQMIYFENDTMWDTNWLNTSYCMQFTGLTDKNGKEIYEGDIISSRPKESVWNLLICKIVFNEVTAKFEAQQYWKTKNQFLSLSNNHDYYEYEVIGNIYENPELIIKL